MKNTPQIEIKSEVINITPRGQKTLSLINYIVQVKNIFLRTLYFTLHPEKDVTLLHS